MASLQGVKVGGEVKKKKKNQPFKKLRSIQQQLRKLAAEYDLDFILVVSQSEGIVIDIEATPRLGDIASGQWWDARCMIPAAVKQAYQQERNLVNLANKETTVNDFPQHFEDDTVRTLVGVLLDGVIKNRANRFSYKKDKEAEVKAAYDWYPEDIPYTYPKNLDTQQCLTLIKAMIRGNPRAELERLLHKWQRNHKQDLVLSHALDNAYKSAATHTEKDHHGKPVLPCHCNF